MVSLLHMRAIMCTNRRMFVPGPMHLACMRDNNMHVIHSACQAPVYCYVCSVALCPFPACVKGTWRAQSKVPL